MEIFHAVDVMLSWWLEVGRGAGITLFREFQLYPLLSSFLGVWTVLWVRSFFHFSRHVVMGWQLDLVIWEVFSNFNDFMILWNSWFPCSAIAARGLAMQLVIGWWEKYCIVYCLFCRVITSRSSSIFLCCLIKLSLSPPTNFGFCPFLLPIPHGEGRGGVSERLSSPSFRLPGETTAISFGKLSLLLILKKKF